MRDMVGCFSEHAIRLSETTCSSQINHHHQHQHQSPIISHQHHLITPSTPATQITVTSQYNITTLSRHLIVIVTLTWSRNQIGHQSLTITFSDNKNPSSSTTSFKLTTTNATRLFRKKKGTKSIELDNSTTKIELLWDLTEANYESSSGGVEPVSGFYLIVLVNSEIGLMLGDLCGEVSNKKLLKSIAGSSSSSSSSSMLSKSALVSRKEYYSGESLLYMTKTKFSECGEMHEISIWCVGENEGLKYPVLCVSVDGRVVVRVKRLKWNFRGNSTVFVDGLLIDLFWDVHGWFFGNSGGCGVFMFRKRCGIESRLWLHQEEEKVKLSEMEMMQQQDGDGGEQFSLLVYASKIVG